MSLDTNPEEEEQNVEEVTLGESDVPVSDETSDAADTDTETSADSASTEGEGTLDDYVNTGIYTEEGKPNGDMLLVLGKDILETHVRQFYLADNNAVFARIETEEWTSWYAIKSDIPSDLASLDLNGLVETNLFDLSSVESFENHPEGFSIGENSLLFCVPVNEEHCLQFLVANARTSFWVRHYNESAWEAWTRFV